jgi:hypothetical protein
MDRGSLKQLIDAAKREQLAQAGDKRIALSPLSANRCAAVLGPFSANPGGVCGRQLKPGSRGCGLHPNG